MASVNDLQLLESKSVEEIYELLGAELLSRTLGADEFSEEEKREKAVEWYEQMEAKLRAVICQSRIYTVYVKAPERWEWLMIAAGIADLIAPFVIGVSPVSAAALIMKKGLNNLCRETT